MKICIACGAEYPDSQRFCARDGAALRMLGGSNDLVGSIVAERYHIARKVGEGGMGAVYLAEHVKLRRKCAVKVMHDGLADDADALARFRREASNACQIDHPNVAAIYDFGEGRDGRVYLAMEFVDGDSLARLIASGGAFSVDRATDIVRQIADGLDAAHTLGIVHRDLKPDNVLVAKHHDGRDKVKVVDFGISKALRADSQVITHTGQLVGTPQYMSPEQLSGAPLDSRSDIYSLGLVTFHMLTGALPFPGKNAHSLMRARLSEPAVRLRDARPEVAWSPRIQRILDHAMRPEPKDRYATARAFAEALREAVDTESARGARP